MKIDPNVREELRRLFREKIETFKEKATVISASKLGEDEKNLLFSHVPLVSRDLNIEYIVDQSLLAGIVVKIGSKVIDLSLKGQLQNIKQKLYENI
ncbi:F0F1 ATP synthase subunit delta [Candidatus Roizmanbacteria bacterium]|nr:F0F1 ATP synthase subunit delta [Candidatus Roizmanbacteria bacterium]